MISITGVLTVSYRWTSVQKSYNLNACRTQDIQPLLRRNHFPFLFFLLLFLGAACLLRPSTMLSPIPAPLVFHHHSPAWSLFIAGLSSLTFLLGAWQHGYNISAYQQQTSNQHLSRRPSAAPRILPLRPGDGNLSPGVWQKLSNLLLSFSAPWQGQRLSQVPLRTPAKR